jgi:trimeric autotransporter adhesin
LRSSDRFKKFPVSIHRRLGIWGGIRPTSFRLPCKTVIHRGFLIRGQILLTTGVDNFPGTTGVDVFQGTISNLAGTLQATDKIDGAGGTDRLDATLSTAWTGFTTGSVKNVETIAIKNTLATASTFDANGITGAKTFSIEAATGGITTLSNLPTGLQTITLKGQTSAFTSSYAAGSAEKNVTTTPLALVLDGVADTASSTAAVTVTLGDVQVINAAVSGTNRVNFGGSPTSLKIEGSGSLRTTDATNTFTSVDGSAGSGAQVISLSGGTANILTSVKTGSGGDTITTTVQQLAKNATIDAGAGTDTLVLSTTASDTVAYTLSGVETLSIGAVAGGTLTLASGKFDSALKTVKYTGGTSSSTDEVVALANVGARDLTYEVTGTATGTADVHTSDGSGLATVKYTAAAATVKAASAADASNASFTFAEASGLDVQMGQFTAPAVTLTAPKATAVSVTSVSAKTSAGTELNSLGTSFVVTADKATSLTVSSPGALAGAQFNVKEATSATITNGATSGHVKLNTYTSATTTSKLKSLTIVSDSALDVKVVDGTTERALTELQTLGITANKNAVRITQDTVTNSSTLAKLNSASLAGSGDGSSVTLGDLGAIDNGYGLSITASGTLKGGVTTGTILITKGQAVVVDATSVTGEVTIGTAGSDAVGDTTNTAGNVSILAPSAGTASGVSSGLSVGNIHASGTVLINAKGAKDTVIGTVSGNTITIDQSNNTNNTVSIGQLTAKSAVDLTLSELATASSPAIVAGTGSTGLAVKIVGGVDAETVTISDGGNAVKSIVVTGDLGAGANTLTVTGTSSTAKTINLSGLANYKNATITGGVGADTILGGSGADRIEGGRGANVLEGGDGADIFFFNLGDSPVTAINKINDLKAEDSIVYGQAALVKATARADTVTSSDAGSIVTGAEGKVIINATTAAATFEGTATGFDTLQEKVALLSFVTDTNAGHFAYFDHAGSTYLFINDGTSAITNDSVIQLVGLSVPATAPTVVTGTGADPTGIYAIGA